MLLLSIHHIRLQFETTINKNSYKQEANLLILNHSFDRQRVKVVQ